MKHLQILFFGVMACVLAACGGNNATTAVEPLPEAEVIADGVTQLRVDSFTTLITLRDNAQPMSQPNSLFYGPEGKDSALVETLSPAGSVPSSIHAFLVRRGHKLILFDTGLGSERGGKLLDRLAATGFGPENIDYVILTHCHADHIGGLLRADTAVFTRAQVLVPEVEYNYWQLSSHGNGLEAIKALDAYGERLHKFLYTDTAALPLGIKQMAAVGHTPGHTVYGVGERLLIAGDLIHGYALQSQNLNISPHYDHNPEQAAATREFFINFATRRKMVIAGMHLPGNGVIIPTPDAE